MIPLQAIVYVNLDIRDFYLAPEVSPRNQSFHYHGNAETYMLVGEAMGKAMSNSGNNMPLGCGRFPPFHFRVASVSPAFS